MKLVKKALTSVLLATSLMVTLTGCISIDADFKIDEENVAVSFENKLNKSSYLELEPNATENQLISLVEQGLPTSGTEDAFKVTENEEYVLFNMKSSTKYNEEGLQLEDGSPLNSIPFDVVKKGSQAEITIDVVSLTGELPNDVFNKMYDEFNITVEFPNDVTAVSHSGKIDKNKVTWTSEEIQDAVKHSEVLKAEGQTAPPFPILLVGLGAVGLLTIAGVVVVIVKKVKKRAARIDQLPNPDIWIPSESKNTYKEAEDSDAGYISSLKLVIPDVKEDQNVINNEDLEKQEPPLTVYNGSDDDEPQAPKSRPIAPR